MFATPEESGGTRHYEIARELTASGTTFTVLTSKTNYLTRGSSETESANSHAGINIRRVGGIGGSGRGFLNRLSGFISFAIASLIVGLTTRRVDVVWGTSPAIFQAVSAYVIARIRRVPFVLEVRDLWPDFAISTGVLRNGAAIWMARLLERFLYRHADIVVINSPGFRDHVIERGAAPYDTCLIPNGVNADEFRPIDATDVRSRYGFDNGVLAVYAGAHGIANGLDTVLDAAALLSDVPMITIALVGDGREKDRLQKRAKDDGLDNVKFVPALPKQEIPTLLCAADIGIATLQPLPLFDTTYPNKVFDYMAAELPTVLAIDGVIREVIEQGDAGFAVKPGDASELAEAIRHYANDPGARKSQGANAGRYVREHFNRPVQAAQFRELFAQVTDHRMGGSTIGHAFKRVLDIAGSLVGLTILFIPLLIVALLVKITSPGPVFYRGERVGRSGRTFRPWKFRTMVDRAATQGLGVTIASGDGRITRIGGFLRTLSIDELPQLINILTGEMSLVGPRPTLRYQVDRYTPVQRQRLLAKPGLTGLAAIRGRNSISWEQRIELDVEYVRRWSFWGDLKILLVTPWIAWVSRKGLYGVDGVNDDFGGIPPDQSQEDDQA
jgi:lipopolysaccharide/colanic/teichoic acid biosynthesis glycosyltransferase